MRLSEAIRLGSLTIECPTRNDINACAITMALNAVGNKAEDLNRYRAIYDEWPWMQSFLVEQCPFCDRATGRKLDGSQIIYHIFDCHVMFLGDRTIEQLADFIATIEPPESVERLESTLDELTEKADEVLATYLPPDWTKQQWIQAMSVHRGEGE